MKELIGYLHFESGEKFQGKVYIPESRLEEFQSEGFWGEAAFTSAMTGFQETMTDPSYLGQHIIFATAHVGNYKTNPMLNQSKKVHASTVMARNFTPNKFFEDNEVPLFTSFDSRKLVKFLTQKNNHVSLLSPLENLGREIDFTEKRVHCSDLERVSQKEIEIINEGQNPIVLINYGCKTSIVNYLKELGFPLVTCPYDITSEEVLKLNPKMIFLSNGPGDPRKYLKQVDVVKELLKSQIPIRGICLGHQLLSLALGGKVYKLPFGHRGINHPVLDQVSGNVLITSQNHGYAVNEDEQDWLINNQICTTHSSLFDQSMEGMSSLNGLYKSVQFHPEAHPGPKDALDFFFEIKRYLNGEEKNITKEKLIKPNSLESLDNKYKKSKFKKILVVGSGPIKIGQASEFDYSGTQACKALKEIGVEVVLLNSNPATIMTDKHRSYKTYVEPITIESILRIIELENVDALLSTMGGQTALNICMELEANGHLKDKNVVLLGAKPSTIERTEDRELFSKELETLGYSTGTRFIAKDLIEALEIVSKELHYPVIIRRNFALGGEGATFVKSKKELEQVLSQSDSFPVTLEKSLIGYKEIELEVMVDCEKNGVIVCSIENIDPCGIHTGDSITVAPAQTISDYCYQKLRTMSLTIAKHMEVVAGGANVQFAINPNNEDDIVVIEMNPRVSRSSALASKATGYPIAKISALLAIGYTLKDILNDITKSSPVSFEPTQDYVALKIPIFPFHKFPLQKKSLGPQMRSVGEVLAIGSNFNEAFLKALRSLEMGLEIPSLYQLKDTGYEIDDEFLENRLKEGRELSLLTVYQALKRGFSVEDIYHYSKITKWFIREIQKLTILEEKLENYKKEELFQQKELFLEAKKNGFSDKHIAKTCDLAEKDVLGFRVNENILPVYKAVDTCSGEFPARTPYFYSTYEVENESKPFDSESISILGSGPNRIGQGIEFDYSCVKACETLKKEKIYSILINSNPETVSTDYDTSDRLYLSPLYSEDLLDIFRFEKSRGVIACFSGQTGINIRNEMENGFRKDFFNPKFLGPSMHSLEVSEDRKLFSEILDQLEVSQTKSLEVVGYSNLVDAMTQIGFPVIIRPSYVIGGESMYVFYSHEDIHKLPEAAKRSLKEGNIKYQVENYLENANEYDVDLVRDSFGNCSFTVCEHIEYAGVHSGDSGMVTPPIYLKKETIKRLKSVSETLAAKLEIVGPINIQYAIKEDEIYVIEANPRGSRTLPFLSKAYDINLPELAVQSIIGKKIQPKKFSEDFYCVKQSTFPFERFPDDDFLLGPKMLSTGETMGVDKNLYFAMLKSYLGNYPDLMKPGKVLISLNDKSKLELIPYIQMLFEMGHEFVATKGTAEFIRKHNMDCEEVEKIGSGENLLNYIKNNKLRMIFNTPGKKFETISDGKMIRKTAILSNIPCFTRIENIKVVMKSILATHDRYPMPVSLQEVHHKNDKEVLHCS